jgi:UDP-N-acetylglucosamine 1-carboxyvinyltransferase
MEKFVVTGGKKLTGSITVSGAKNAALKALVASCLTDEEVIIDNFPIISDLYVMKDIITILGGNLLIKNHTVFVQVKNMVSKRIPLDMAARIRTSAMFIAPLLVRTGKAVIPDPGGDRIGARPIDRIVNGLKKMGVSILYNDEDGYFYAKAEKMHPTEYTFTKNTHTGTETLILASVLGVGKTVLKNAALEPEVDELISLLNLMGAKVFRSGVREITIQGVKKLHGVRFRILPDRNEIATFAIAAILTKGDITVKDVAEVDLHAFLSSLIKAGGAYERIGNDIRFFYTKELNATNIHVGVHPGFMTDWQAPWAVLMTQANGESMIHETVFEYRFGYVKELRRMGAHITFYDPVVKNPDSVYNFNLRDDKPDYFRAIKISGPTYLHNAVVTITDLRAGATLVLAALIAKGTSTIFGLDQLDRGYEKFEKRLSLLGAQIKRIKA